ncbi:hypothetical protein [Mariniblastus fucicola]|uniref:Uncharacterized protein n=1 Tax=Mariniblastus fucicola TaxID=980251 RepID=A0A5B9PBR4_9BACT|nr:hypothetical protein [Mariniblastus fucicola]QEG22919.1 hypothetical protein MFFC18_28070 [Mariniblastus fucicola]
MKLILIPVLFFVVCLQQSLPNAVGQSLKPRKTTIAESEFSEYASVYEFYLSNMLAWETGEFMVKVVKTIDSTGRMKNAHLVSEESRIYRIKFDYPNKRFLCLIEEEFTPKLLVHASITDEMAKKNKKRFAQFGFCCLDDEMYLRNVPEKTRYSKQSNPIERLSKQFKVPEFRTFGLLTESSGARLSQLEEIIPRLASGSGIVEANHSTKGVLKFVKHSPIKSSGGEQYFVTTTEFDSKTMMPRMRNIEVSVLKDAKRKRVKDSAEKLKWRTIAGVHVPASLTKEGKGTQRVF